MVQPGAMTPDLEVERLRGGAKRLHDFRRRSHVLLVVDPDGSPAARAAREQRAAEEAQRWTWLQTELVRPAVADAPGWPAGNHLLSRWGRLIASYPPGPWDLARIEDDLLHWEAQDCCDLRSSP